MPDIKDEDIENPWVTVPKRKRGGTFPIADTIQHNVAKSDVDNLQTNTFLNLSLQEDFSGESTSSGPRQNASVDTSRRPIFPDLPSPPRKRTKKDAKKVQSLQSLKTKNLRNITPSLKSAMNGSIDKLA
jgi:hypothetical protein